MACFQCDDEDVADLRARVQGLSSAEAEWRARKCECGADDACAFARERDEADRRLRSLLAVVHRDGGQHSDRVGVEQSVADAREKIVEAVQQRDEARAELDTFALAIGYGQMPEGQGGIDRLSGAELAAEYKQMARNRDDAVAALGNLEESILELFPYRYDDGTDDEADPGECIGYAAEELARLRKQVERLKAALRTCAETGETRVAEIARQVLEGGNK